jgi:DNA-binding LacI/PurR family transcriptional regulator
VDIRDIAKRARVSIATVSRTINRVPSVKPLLARRVWQVVNEQGYYPNTHARSLVSGKSRIFGIITPGICHPFYASIVEQFQVLAEEHNYEVILSTTGENSECLRAGIRRMMERRAEGIVIVGIDATEEIVSEISHEHIPLVFADLAITDPPGTKIHIDYLNGIRQAVQHLAALRHKRIAFVAGPTSSSSAVARKNSFERSMEETELRLESRLLLTGEHSIKSGTDAVAKFARFSEPPTAVICSSDLIAVGVLQEAHSRKISVPRDLSVVGIEDSRLAQFTVPPLTTVRVPQHKLAERAFSALHRDVGTRPFRSEEEGWEVTTELVLRSSTAVSLMRGQKTLPARAPALP